MPTYCWKCKHCGLTRETTKLSLNECECGRPMSRDWRAEGATNTFKPSVDVYAKSLKQRKPRGEGYV